MEHKKNHRKSSRYSMVFILAIILTSSISAYGYLFADEHSIVNNQEKTLDSMAVTQNYNMDVGYPYNWIDATNGTVLSLSDDSSATIVLPFSFTFYDQSFTNLYVGSNGWFSFSNNDPYRLDNPTFPSTDVYFHYSIALFWDDLYPSGNIYYQFLSGPNRVVVSFVDMDHIGSTRAGSFELILFETGEILFQYDYIDDIGSHTVGLNYGVDASYYNQYTGLTPSTEDLAILFSTEDPEHELTANIDNFLSVPIGDSKLVNATVTNRGLNNESDVELQLWIEEILIDSDVYPTLANGTNQTLQYLWTPAAIGVYNITAYAVPVVNESISTNNIFTFFASVYDPTDMKVAILNSESSDEPSYWVGGWANNYLDIYNGLITYGFNTILITNSDILSGGLSGVSVLIMVDNAPSEAASIIVKDWSFSGGHIISFDSSICFINWAGILPPEAEGTNGIDTYWNYGSTSSGVVVVDHPIVDGYSYGETIYGTSGDAQYISSAMQASLASPYYTPIVKTFSGSDYDLIAAYEPHSGQGFVVHIWDTKHWLTDTNQLLIVNSIYWLQGIDVSVYVDMLYPSGGEILSGEIEISWITEGFDPFNLSYSLFVKNELSDVWNPLVEGLTRTDILWETTSVVDGLYRLRVIATNGTCTRFDQALIQIENVNYAPTVSIVQPITGSTYRFVITIEWTASDPDGDILIFDIYYWNGSNWVELAIGLATNSFYWDISTLPNGFGYKIRINTTDIEYAVTADTGYFKISNPINFFLTTNNSGFVMTILVTATALGIISRFLKRKKL